VKAGDVLIELDPTSNEADEKRLAHDFVQDRLDAARLRALLSDDLASFASADDTSPSMVAIARHEMEAQAAEQAAKLAGIDRQIAQKQAEGSEVKASIAKIDAVLPVLRAQRDVRENLLRNEFGSRLLYLQAEQQVVEQEKELVVLHHRQDEAGEALAVLRRQRAQVDAEYRKLLLADLAKAENQATEHREEATKAAQRRALQTLTAPVDARCSSSRCIR